MLFWLCLVIGILFGWLGLKKGLYVAIAMLFNLMIGVYVSVLATLRILYMNPEYGQSGYYAAMTMFFLSIIIFGVLQLIAWFYFLHDIEEYFPKLIEQLGGAICGFLFGYLLLSMAVLSICIMPFSRQKIPLVPQREKMIEFSRSPVIKVCDFIGFYSLEYFDGQPDVVIEALLSIEQDKKPVPVTPKKEEKSPGTTI